MDRTAALPFHQAPRFALDDEREITHLLEAHEAGDLSALDRVVPLVYDELLRIARRHRRRRPYDPLDTTDLVHEAYLKLVRSTGLRIHDPGHLLAITACAMRQVLLSRARERCRQKRGDGEVAIPLEEARAPGVYREAEALLDLDRALSRLRRRDARLAAIFDCRYFGGLSEEETAEALNLSLRTCQRGWMRARAWLRADLEGAYSLD
jgi:RNA polymerase sigma factor (TIGR02999 family)